MKEEIFRKESLDKMESPDDLDRYVKVTTPKVWILLLAIVVILIGGCVWGFFGKMNTVVKGYCFSKGGVQECYINESDAERINTGDQVKIADTFGTVTEVTLLPQKSIDVAREHNYFVSEDESKIDVREFSAKTDIPDGEYYMEVIVESKAPFSFVFNY